MPYTSLCAGRPAGGKLVTSVKRIRALYANAPGRDHQIKALTLQWPQLHYDAYQRAFFGLLARRVIEDAGAQAFKITDVGLRFVCA